MKITIQLPPGKWKQLKKSRYFVSYTGQILSIEFNGFHYVKQRIEHGYYRVALNLYGGKSSMHSVHRLVAQLFKKNPKDLPLVGHKDNNKLNNVASNLLWCTHSQNSQHSYDTNNREPSRTCKITDYDVKRIRRLFAQGRSQRKLAVEYGITQGHVSELVNRKKRNNI